MSDLKFIDTAEGGDFLLNENRDFVLTDNLFNSAYISVYTNDWWGNQLLDNEYKTDSKVDKLRRSNLTNEARLKIIDNVKRSLSYFLDLKIAKNIFVDGVITSPDTIRISIDVEKFDGVTESENYEINWQSQLQE